VINLSTISTVAEANSGGALSTLGLDLKSFLFQLITFVLLLLTLRKWAFPVLVKTLEERRKAVEQSIDQAKETEQAMHQAEAKIEQMLREARDESQELVAAGNREAAKVVEDAEAKAAKRAEHIVKEAESRMDNELNKAREALKAETAQLVAAATGYIIKEKIDAKKNASLVADALAVADKERK
jgi:F-type H+-transporting ATPase subunit b